MGYNPTWYKTKRSTKVTVTNDNVSCRYHNTEVVKVDYHDHTALRHDIRNSTGTITLNSGGYRTKTTMLRMNQVARNHGFRFSVWTEGGTWFVTYWPPLSRPYLGVTEVFHDGIKIPIMAKTFSDKDFYDRAVLVEDKRLSLYQVKSKNTFVSLSFDGYTLSILPSKAWTKRFRMLYEAANADVGDAVLFEGDEALLYMKHFTPDTEGLLRAGETVRRQLPLSVLFNLVGYDAELFFSRFL